MMAWIDALSWVTLWPHTKPSPADGSISPVIMLNNVLLPAPLQSQCSVDHVR